MTARTKASKATKTDRSTAKVRAEKPVALTLKIDSQTYQRLSVLRAKDRKTAQDILSEALMVYLDRAGA